jgi:two-component system, OmpR family, response regulator
MDDTRGSAQTLSRKGRFMKTLVVEDDLDTSRYVANGLRECGHVVTCCDNGLDGLHQAVNETWDLLIVDRLLPGGIDGVAIVGRLRELKKRTPVLILSALNSTDERVRGLRHGADDYLSKPFAFAELIARVEALLRRAQPEPGALELRVADLCLDLRTLQVMRGRVAITLQPRELRLLTHLMRNADQVVTRTMLLEAVWDCHFDPQTSVIDVQISRLRSKIDRGFSPPLIHTIRGAGYMLGERPSAGPAS